MRALFFCVFFFVVSNIITTFASDNYKTIMIHRTLLLSILAMMMMPAWAGGAKEEIASKITQLYDAIAKRAEGGTTRFACKNWWKTVAEVEKKDQTK